MTQHNWAFVSENTYMETKRTLQGLQAEVVILRTDNKRLRDGLRRAWLTTLAASLASVGVVTLMMWRGGC